MHGHLKLALGGFVQKKRIMCFIIHPLCIIFYIVILHILKSIINYTICLETKMSQKYSPQFKLPVIRNTLQLIPVIDYFLGFRI